MLGGVGCHQNGNANFEKWAALCKNRSEDLCHCHTKSNSSSKPAFEMTPTTTDCANIGIVSVVSKEGSAGLVPDMTTTKTLEPVFV